MELETDKAVLEVPSEKNGIIMEILVSESDEILVGQTILLLSVSGAAVAEPKKKALLCR